MRRRSYPAIAAMAQLARQQTAAAAPAARCCADPRSVSRRRGLYLSLAPLGVFFLFSLFWRLSFLAAPAAAVGVGGEGLPFGDPALSAAQAEQRAEHYCRALTGQPGRLRDIQGLSV